jgi:uncharacterized membrane protein YraQ (UPF0718 family)
MSFVKKAFANNKLVFIVAFVYGVLFIFMPGKAIQSLQNSWYYIKEMLMIMPVILLLTSLINAWVPRKTIENNFGQNSGFRGSVFSFLLGSFSAGPIYAAFPVCRMLLKKGASISNIVIILSTWAVIKVPMLLNESKFLGTKIMFVRWILTTLAIFTMGYITSKLVKKSDIPMEKIDMLTEDDALSVSSDYCIGCGICSKIAQNNFRILNRKAMVISQNISKQDKERVKEAMEKCPPKAIRFTDRNPSA